MRFSVCINWVDTPAILAIGFVCQYNRSSNVHNYRRDILSDAQEKGENMQLGQLFRAQRLRVNLTQAQLSEKTQVPVDMIRALEAGKQIDENALMTLAGELGIREQDVFSAMQQTQQEASGAGYGQRAAEPRMEEPSRMSRVSRDPYAQREVTPEAPRSEGARARNPYAQNVPDNYVSPIPQDDDERMLQEIRRQRRRQAYEGTLRTQRRMNDTARMQEILRQQAQAAARQQEQERAAYRREYEPAPQERPAQNFAGYEQPQERPVQNFAGYEQPQERPVQNFAGYEQPQERPVQSFAGYEQPQERPAQNFAGYEQPQERPVQNFAGYEQPQERPVQNFAGYEQPQERPARNFAGYEQPRPQRERAAQATPEYAQPKAEPYVPQAAPRDDAQSYIRMLHVAADIAQLSGRETVLEVGCGNGELTSVLAQRSRFVAVVDASTRALEATRAACAAQGFANVDFLEGDARRLPIESGSFDVVYIHMLLHHVISAQQVLAEARRVLKPGGCVVVTEIMPSDVPAQQRIQNAVEVLKNPTHIGVIPMQDVMRMMQHAGLKVVDRRVLDQMWEFEQWVKVMGAGETKEPLRALMRSFALQGNRAGMDLAVDKTGRMTFTYRWMYLVGVPEK